MLEKKRDGIVWFCHCKVKLAFCISYFLKIYMGKIERTVESDLRLVFLSFIIFKDIYGEK